MTIAMNRITIFLRNRFLKPHLEPFLRPPEKFNEDRSRPQSPSILKDMVNLH